jgi:hypothetical protein
VTIGGTVLKILVLRADVVAALGSGVAATLASIVRGETPIEVEVATPPARCRYPTGENDHEDSERQA